MRTFILYVLVIATLLPTVSPWGIIAHYQLNKDYLARVLCENRDRPELHCDGQCYLAKRLKEQQDKQDKETTERVQNTPAIQLFCESVITFDFSPNEENVLASAHFSYQSAFTYQLIKNLFRPPNA